ncbi:hypothetical protein HY495_02375 [Candidatus Woesearchaeota archaeon]|nr:hypothetical protein [Candidatus Woesearchaeota archaeon]
MGAGNLLKLLSTVYVLGSCSPPVQFLAVNSSPTAPIVYKQEKEAFKDLRKLVAEAEVEEAWCYVPEETSWHDIGLEVAVGNGRATVDYDLQKIGKLAAEHETLDFYHLHPQPMMMNLIAPYVRDPSLSRRYSKQRIKEIFTADAAVPSPDDLGSAIYLACTYQQPNRQQQFRFFIASHYGITNYTPQPELLTDFCRLFGGANLLTLATAFGKNILEELHPEVVERKIKRAVAGGFPTSLSPDLMITIEFIPYDRRGSVNR